MLRKYRFRFAVIICTVITNSVALAQPKVHSFNQPQDQEAIAPRYEMDPKLLQDWTEAAQMAEECKVPFVATYKDRDRKKTLRFVAAEHEQGAESSTAKLFKKTIDKNKPDFLIVEGFPSNLSAAEIEKIVNKKCSSTKQTECNEIDLAIKYAVQNKIPFKGGEPSRDEEIAVLKNAGLSKVEIAGYYWLRQITQLKRESRLKDDAQYKTEYQNYIRSVGDELRLTDDEFKSWYKKKFKKEFNWDDIKTEHFAPIKSGSYLQQISHKVSRVRDSHILKVISEALEKHNNVIIQYGSGHHVKQRNALKAVLPIYTYTCEQ